VKQLNILLRKEKAITMMNIMQNRHKEAGAKEQKSK